MDPLDELFNEPTIKVDLPLKDRIEELRLSGCAQKASWSRHGSIAYITSDGCHVETRHLMCDTETGKWVLSPPYPQPSVSEAHENAPLVHLSWNTLGAELGVVDAHGRVSFHVITFAINVLSCMRPATLDQEDDLNGIVGFGWLNIDRQLIVYRAASRQGPDQPYRYPVFQCKPPGPFHPATGRTAGLGVTRSGVVKLWYQLDQVRYHEVTCELETLLTSEDLFSHAAFSSDRDSTLILAAYTLSGQLRVYRINLNWNAHEPSSQHVSTAKLSVKRLLVEDNARPIDRPSANILTRLEIFPPEPIPTRNLQQPVQFLPIVICATHLSLGRETFTVVSRWELRNKPREINPVLTQLSGKQLQPMQLVRTELNRLEDVVFDKCILDIVPNLMSMSVSFTCSDGSVIVRERGTLNDFGEPNFDTIFNLSHVGFRFRPRNEIYKSLTLSPNYCVAFSITTTDTVNLLALEYPRPLSETDYGPIAAAVSQRHAQGSKTNVTVDDILYMVQPLKTPQFTKAMLNECHVALGFSIDFIKETPSEKVFRNLHLQKSLSLQNIIEYEGDSRKRSIPAKTAWVLLLLRMTCFAYSNIIAVLNRQPVISESPDALEPYLGVIQWNLQLFALITSDLLELRKACRGRERDLTFVRQKSHELNSPALFILLSSATRLLLRYSVTAVKSLHGTIDAKLKALHHEDTQGNIFRSFKLLFSETPLDLLSFEAIIAQVEAGVKSAYEGAPQDLDRSGSERSIFVDAQIPAVLTPVVAHLLTTLLDTLYTQLPDPSRLFFADFSALSLHDDAHTRMFRRENKVDVYRKIVIPRNADTCRCVRCGSWVEEARGGGRPGGGAFLGNLSRTCVCGGFWMREKGKKEAEARK